MRALLSGFSAAVLVAHLTSPALASELYAPADEDVAKLRGEFAKAFRMQPDDLMLEKPWTCQEYRWEIGGYYVAALEEKSFEFYLGGDPINRGYFNRGSSEARKLLSLDQGFLAASPDGPPARRVLLLRALASGEMLVEHAELPLFTRPGALRSAVDPTLDIVGYSLCRVDAKAPAPVPAHVSEPADNSPYFPGVGLPGLERDSLASEEFQNAMKDLFSLPVPSIQFKAVAFLRSQGEWKDSATLGEEQESCLVAQMAELAEATLTIGAGNHERGVPSAVRDFFKAASSLDAGSPELIVALHDSRDSSSTTRSTLAPNARIRDPRCEGGTQIRIRTVLGSKGCQVEPAKEILSALRQATVAIKRPRSCE